ncbi:hypothetical protein ACTXT7_003139 [Hymenolepis weldensis]
MECVQKFEKRLNSMYERLLSSFTSTKQVIDVEVMKQSHTIFEKRSFLIEKLEAQFKEDVQLVERLIGLLDYAKGRNDFERNGVIAYIESQLNNKFGKNNGYFAFNYDSSLLRDAILCFGEIERNESESFEILDCTPTTSRTCSLCVCEKMDKAPMVAGKHSTENLTIRPSEGCNLFPFIPKDANAWLSKTSKSCKLENTTEKDLEDKLEALAIKQENDKPARDIESLILRNNWISLPLNVMAPTSDMAKLNLVKLGFLNLTVKYTMTMLAALVVNASRLSRRCLLMQVSNSQIFCYLNL